MPRRSAVVILTFVADMAVLGLLSPSATAVQEASKSSASKRPTKEAERDPFDVPDGAIDELQKYIDGLSKLHPSSSLRPAISELRRKRATAQLKASDKILAARPNSQQAQAAIRAKVAALAVLAKSGDSGAQEALDATAQQVDKLGLKEMVRDVRLAALLSRSELAAAMNDEEYRKLVQRVKGSLEEGPIDLASADIAVRVAMAAELSNRPALAIGSYGELAAVVVASKDASVAGVAATMLGAARRLQMVGKPLALDGVTVAGKPLQWNKYRGKVVLVDFFATWCGPCRAEIPNIARCYRDYHKRGFDVVGISVDHQRKPIEDYVEKEKLPWTILLDRNEARGTDKSMATYYGIFAIPQMILVGKDGKVLDLNARGDRLGKRLEELLGPVEPRP